MKRITEPKFVKRAKLWCVTIINGTKQTQEWFSTEEEAKVWVKEQTKKENV